MSPVINRTLIQISAGLTAMGGQALAKIGWLNHHGEWDLQSGFWLKRLPYAIF
jgi:hypothetical protein